MPSARRRATVTVVLGSLLLGGCGLIRPEKSAHEWAASACYSFDQAKIGDPSGDQSIRLKNLNDAIQAATNADGGDGQYQPLVRALMLVRSSVRPELMGNPGAVPAEKLKAVQDQCAAVAGVS